MSGNQIALAVGAAVILGGVVRVLARLPPRVWPDSPDPQRRTESTGKPRNAHATAGIKKDAVSQERPDPAVHLRADGVNPATAIQATAASVGSRAGRYPRTCCTGHAKVQGTASLRT
jgi:hypothetical protein